jgi:hypothetical protein
MVRSDRLIVISSIVVLFSPMPLFNYPKEVHITGSTITNVENQSSRDKCTKRVRFDLPKHIILIIHLSYP